MSENDKAREAGNAIAQDDDHQYFFAQLESISKA